MTEDRCWVEWEHNEMVPVGGAPAAGRKLIGAINVERKNFHILAMEIKMADDVEADKLKKITSELIDVISSAPFVAAMKKLKATPVEKRLALASKTLTPAALSKAGVKLPKDMRITSRYFEPGNPDIIEVTDHGAALRHLNSIPGLTAKGAWGCACGGAATVCGGAGGGS